MCPADGRDVVNDRSCVYVAGLEEVEAPDGEHVIRADQEAGVGDAAACGEIPERHFDRE